MRPRCWRLVSSHFPSVAQTTRSSLMLCSLLSAVHCFCAVWNETVRKFYTGNEFGCFCDKFCRSQLVSEIEAPLVPVLLVSVFVGEGEADG